MKTSPPPLVPLFRSEMQLRLLALLLLQPERAWTLAELAGAVGAPSSSVHRELARAEAAGLIARDATARPHRFRAAMDDALYEPLRLLLERTVGVEAELRGRLDRDDVEAALIYGSWATGERRPNSDIDVLVVGTADLVELRRAVRSVGTRAGRTIDVTAMPADELRRSVRARSSFGRRLLEAKTIPLIGRLDSVLSDDRGPRRASS